MSSFNVICDAKFQFGCVLKPVDRESVKKKTTKKQKKNGHFYSVVNEYSLGQRYLRLLKR